MTVFRGAAHFISPGIRPGTDNPQGGFSTTMRFMRFILAPTIVLAVVLAACGGTTSSTDASDPAQSTQTSAPTATDETDGSTGDGSAGDAGGDATASVDVTVTGGEFEGTYSGSVPDGGCSRGATGENSFGLQYSTDEAVELSSLQLIVNDADAAAGGTDDFMTMLTFGDLLEGTTIEIEPPEANGSGTVTVDDRGDSATIEIEAETSDGVAIDATVECHSVFDLGG